MLLRPSAEGHNTAQFAGFGKALEAVRSELRVDHGQGVFMAAQGGRCHGLSALPDERSAGRKAMLELA